MTAKEAYDCYTLWCKDNGYGVDNKGNFLATLEEYGYIKRTEQRSETPYGGRPSIGYYINPL